MYYWNLYKPKQSSWFILARAEIYCTAKEAAEYHHEDTMNNWISSSDSSDSGSDWAETLPPSPASCKITKEFFPHFPGWPLRCLGLTGRRFQMRWDLLKSPFSSCFSCSILKIHVYISFHGDWISPQREFDPWKCCFNHRWLNDSFAMSIKRDEKLNHLQNTRTF